MPNNHRINANMSNSLLNAKNSLTFENVVCSQLELKRRAASFSRRRSTMCRRPSVYVPPATPTTSISQSNGRTLSIAPQNYLTPRESSTDTKRSRASSMVSMTGNGLETIGERQSFSSMFYWGDPPSRNTVIKKV
jgi:hypothetical protein